MTTKERQTLQKFFNRMTEFDIEQEEMLHNLMDLNQTYGDGSRWCSWKANLDGILENCEDSIIRGRAETMYRRFLEAQAKEDLLMELGSDLADLGFWKNK